MRLRPRIGAAGSRVQQSPLNPLTHSAPRMPVFQACTPHRACRASCVLSIDQCVNKANKQIRVQTCSELTCRRQPKKSRAPTSHECRCVGMSSQERNTSNGSQSAVIVIIACWRVCSLLSHGCTAAAATAAAASLVEPHRDALAARPSQRALLLRRRRPRREVAAGRQRQSAQVHAPLPGCFVVDEAVLAPCLPAPSAWPSSTFTAQPASQPASQQNPHAGCCPLPAPHSPVEVKAAHQVEQALQLLPRV